MENGLDCKSRGLFEVGGSYPPSPTIIDTLIPNLAKVEMQRVAVIPDTGRSLTEDIMNNNLCDKCGVKLQIGLAISPEMDIYERSIIDLGYNEVCELIKVLKCPICGKSYKLRN